MLGEKLQKEKRIRYDRLDGSRIPKAGVTSTLCSPDEWAPLPKGYRKSCP